MPTVDITNSLGYNDFHFWPVVDGQLTSTVDIILMPIQSFCPLHNTDFIDNYVKALENKKQMALLDVGINETIENKLAPIHDTSKMQEANKLRDKRMDTKERKLDEQHDREKNIIITGLKDGH